MQNPPIYVRTFCELGISPNSEYAYIDHSVKEDLATLMKFGVIPF